ncbi:hypothetical protein CUC32_08335, partial [Campylobacter jejuni]|nr:hypothetical protein [Campylobacter jejuni]
MDVTMSFCYKNLDFKIIKYINYLYEQLYLLKKKILVLLLFDLKCINDNKNKSANFITEIHKQLSLFYDFNLIDLHQKMIDTKCFKFYTTSIEPYHLLATIMYQLGKNISENLNYFKFSERKLIFETNAIFKVLSLSNPCLKAYKVLIYNDKYVEILDKDLISFPKPYIDYKILGVHAFLPTKKGVLSSYQSMCENYFSMVFKNSKKEIVKSFRCDNNFDWLYDDFVIDNDTIVMYNKDNLPITEISYETTIIHNLSNTSDKVSIVNFLLVKDDPNFIQIKNNFSQYKYTKDFSYLIPPIEMYRDIIEEYTLKTSKLIEISSLN